jgi:hypothetical protein
MLTKEEILSCPFCNGEPILIERGNSFTKKRSAEIECTNCHVKIIVGAIHHSLDWCKEKVIEKWNKREYANQDKWINVKDELPPIDEADNWNKSHEVSITVFTYSDFGMRKGTYYRLSECWTVENVTGEIKVTHWMPLPQKPKQ